MKAKINITLEQIRGHQVEKKYIDKVAKKIAKAFKRHYKSHNIVTESTYEIKHQEIEMDLIFKRIGHYEVNKELLEKEPQLSEITRRKVKELCDEMISYYAKKGITLITTVKVLKD